MWHGIWARAESVSVRIRGRHGTERQGEHTGRMADGLDPGHGILFRAWNKTRQSSKK